MSQEIGGLSQEIAGLSQEAGGSPQEIGLRLELTATAAAALVASGLLAGDPAALQSHSVYFDTPGQDLSAAGFSLRIREAEGERVQIVKATGSAAGLFVRPEWNLPVQADVPILDETSPVAALLGTTLHEIGPAFTVDMQRRVWNVLSDEAEIELALEEGEYRCRRAAHAHLRAQAGIEGAELRRAVRRSRAGSTLDGPASASGCLGKPARLPSSRAGPRGRSRPDKPVTNDVRHGMPPPPSGT